MGLLLALPGKGSWTGLTGLTGWIYGWLCQGKRMYSFLNPDNPVNPV
jgi:hypothetical protein